MVKTKNYYQNLVSHIRKKSNNLSNQRDFFAIGLVSCLDKIIEWKPSGLQKTLGQEPDVKVRSSLPDKVRTSKDFLELIVTSLEKGKGDDIPITAESVCEYVEKIFQTRSSLGGTGAQAAKALSRLSFPVLFHYSTLYKEVKELLSSRFLYTISRNGKPVKIGQFYDHKNYPYEPHYIFQFEQGDSITIDSNTITAPRANRVIVPYDETNNVLSIRENYFDYILENLDSIRTLALSGFNTIRDEAVLSRRIDTIRPYLREILNRREHPLIYLEDAAYHVPEYKALVLQELGDLLDVFSLNEEELASLVSVAGESLDISQPSEVVRELSHLSREYSISSIVMHSKHYSTYYGCELDTNIGRALACGNLMAGTKAMLGNYGTLEDLKRNVDLAESQKGVEFAAKASELSTDQKLVAVPAKSISSIDSSVGLGDTFMAGMQIFLVNST